MIKRWIASARRAYHRRKMRKERGYSPESYGKYLYHERKSRE